MKSLILLLCLISSICWAESIKEINIKDAKFKWQIYLKMKEQSTSEIDILIKNGIVSPDRKAKCNLLLEAKEMGSINEYEKQNAMTSSGEFMWLNCRVGDVPVAIDGVACIEKKVKGKFSSVLGDRKKLYVADLEIEIICIPPVR